MIFEPLDFIARLAALVPKPRINLTRFHGLFAPNSKHRAMVTPAGRASKKEQAAVNRKLRAEISVISGEFACEILRWC